MTTIYKRLLEYFENTPKSKIKLDWESTAKYDDVEGPYADEFLKHSYYCNLKHYDVGDVMTTTTQKINLQTAIKNPKFTSGFFIQ